MEINKAFIQDDSTDKENDFSNSSKSYNAESIGDEKSKILSLYTSNDEDFIFCKKLLFLFSDSKNSPVIRIVNKKAFSTKNHHDIEVVELVPDRICFSDTRESKITSLCPKYCSIFSVDNLKDQSKSINLPVNKITSESSANRRFLNLKYYFKKLFNYKRFYK